MKQGLVVMTSGISDAMEGDFKFFNEVMIAFNRYSNKDLGTLCDEDKAMNEYAITHNERIFARYNTSKGPIYIITEWDRSVTTILFADE